MLSLVLSFRLAARLKHQAHANGGRILPGHPRFTLASRPLDCRIAGARWLIKITLKSLWGSPGTELVSTWSIGSFCCM